MRDKMAYDIPTRLFHWVFAGLFIGAFAIAKTIDDDSPIYSYHMLAGLTLSFAVILRIIWGFVGAPYARFSSFALNPSELLKYFTGILSGAGKRSFGHNPASSWAAILMGLLALGLGTTGFLMASGQNKETFEDIHEIFANTFIVVVILHIAGIIVHTLRHKEAIGLSMIDGKKESVPGRPSIERTYPLIGAVFIILAVIFAGNLIRNYDSKNRSLNFFGTTLQLGENEENETEEKENED